MVCRACSMDNPPNARFCGHCGVSQISTVSPPTEMKYPVTIADASKANDPNTITFPFHGTYESSPNNLLTLGWGLALASERILCMKGGQILWQKDLKHVSSGAVTDNGWVAVSTFDTPNKIWIYTPEGELFFNSDLEFPFFIEKCGLDPQEMFAWCTSSQKLSVFSLLQRTRVLNTDRPKWPIIGITQLDGQIQVETSQMKYLYTNFGQLLTSEAEIDMAWERFLVGKGNPLDVLSIANQHLQVTPPERMPPGERDFVIGMLHHLLDIIPPRTHDRARSNRMLGEIALACGDKSTALFHFRAALGDDSKIGVTLLVKRLEKEVDTGKSDHGGCSGRV
jgi:hypothetical protein